MGNFANVFKQLRIEKGFTQEQLANALGISRSAVGMYESGKRIPDSEDLEKFADFFNVDIDYLLGRSQQSTYYVNPETAKVAQEILDNKELSMLFDVSKDISPEDLKVVYQMVLALKRKEQGD